MRILFYAPTGKPDPWLAGLRAQLPAAEIEAWQPGAPPADAAVLWSPPQQLFDEQPQLKAVFNLGAGMDALLKLQLPKDALLVRLEDAGMAVQMAEYVCHYLVRHVREFDQLENRWVFRKPLDRAEFPVGVMGLGQLGSRVAQAVLQFDFPVVGWSRTPRDLPGVKTFAGEAGLPEFLSQTRVLVCLLPLTPDTRDILNRDTLGRLKPGGYLINVARGAHLVEEDLLALLDSGHMAGAALDVFRTEPLPAGHPFWNHPKVTVTPHISGRTLREESIRQIAGKIRALERGEPVAGVVERERGY
ncbi:MAG: glyoxylate/hydroxypyruvate reductase A [Burkholderiales bacterium]|nr:glyoxylate/hydroxypyruvate reductase A [Burkholderiales bacterium]